MIPIVWTICVYLISASGGYSQGINYHWSQQLPPGNGAFEEHWRPGKFPMGIVPVIAFDHKLFMIGQKRTWISTDGIQWTRHEKTDWGERHGMSFTFFNNKLWAMGGMQSWDKFHNDIWVSDDGLDWHLIKLHAEWKARRGHCVVSFNDRLWLYGGSASSGISDTPPTQCLNDIWSSEDGISWLQETNRACWTGREPRLVMHRETLFLIGDTNSSDAWMSADGVQWTLLSEKCPWPARQNYGLLSLDGLIWLLGGRGQNDVWSSVDGKIWKKQPQAPWTTRTTEQSIVYRDKIWIYSGKTGRADSWEGDIWTMSK